MPARPSWRHVAGLALVAGLGAALIGPFATWPGFRHMPEGQATMKVSFSHEGDRAEPCRALSEDELAALPKHMRKTEDCPRRRLPVAVEVLLDGRPLLVDESPPTGFAGDGASRFYARATVPQGAHDLTLRLRDTARAQGFDHEANVAVDLAPAQVLVIGFDAERRVFVVR
ncbi:MAG: hypothetical protein WD673_16960 [Alphaproteobacteria bacterium]